jgi:hypothetical protein
MFLELKDGKGFGRLKHPNEKVLPEASRAFRAEMVDELARQYIFWESTGTNVRYVPFRQPSEVGMKLHFSGGKTAVV